MSDTEDPLIYAARKIKPWRDKVATLEADNAKLRDALQAFVDEHDVVSPLVFDFKIQTARTVLQGEE